MIAIQINVDYTMLIIGELIQPVSFLQKLELTGQQIDLIRVLLTKQSEVFFVLYKSTTMRVAQLPTVLQVNQICCVNRIEQFCSRCVDTH